MTVDRCWPRSKPGILGFKTFKLFKPFQPPSLSSPATRGKMKKGD
jgi:hypothetical protein